MPVPPSPTKTSLKVGTPDCASAMVIVVVVGQENVEERLEDKDLAKWGDQGDAKRSRGREGLRESNGMREKKRSGG